MDHPLQVGQTYENENGICTVLEINQPRMTIRYENGSTATVTIAVQGRIHGRMQAERQIAVREKRRKVRAGRPFSGLKDSDFKKTIEGAPWRGSEARGRRSRVARNRKFRG